MGQGKKIVLTEKQEAWLVKHFKHTKNADVAAKLGISPRAVARFAARLGLKKTPQFMKKCQREMTDAAHRSHLRNGTYPPKGYQIPGSEEHRFKPGESPKDRTTPKRWAERNRKALLSKISKHGVSLTIPYEEMRSIKKIGKQSIFGGGFLLSSKAAAEKAAAEKIQLTDVELRILAELDGKVETPPDPTLF